ncbi:MAG: GGDEF domain-containing protein [Proteobacteria bacterium]|nr:GGDEF domain-containing protein [Pseudomonadota bacterium]
MIMEILPWALVGLMALVVVALSLRLKKLSSEKSSTDIWKSSVVTDLRTQMKKMEERYKAQMEFMINFPEVVKNLTAALSVGQVTAALSRGLTALLDPKLIAIFVAHGKGRFRLVDGAGFPRELRGRFDCSSTDTWIAPLLEYRGISKLKDHPIGRQYLLSIGLTPDMAAPIWYGDRFLGLIMISNPTIDKQMSVRTLAMISDMVSVSLHAAGLVTQIRKKAELDPLTSLANRRTLMARATAEIQRSHSYQLRMSLAMIDVDHFKQYNDRNGQSAGDAVLKAVASLIAGTIRRTDMVARYGGEVFTALFFNADHDMTFHTAERIRRLIEQTAFPQQEHQPLGKISVSVGVATYPEDAADLTSLFKAADSALYQAKSQGRNRVNAYPLPSLEEMKWREDNAHPQKK